VYPTDGRTALECNAHTLARVQTPQSTAKRSVAGPANATVEPCQAHGTTTSTRSQEGFREKPVGIVDGSTTPTGPSVGVALGWEAGAYERDRAALARDSAAAPRLADSKARLLAMAAATEAAHAMESAGVAVALPPPVTRTTPAAADPPQKRRLPRSQWLKREHDREKLRARCVERPKPPRALPLTAAEYSPGREKFLIESKAKVRTLMHPSAARRRADALRNHADTAYLWTAIKGELDAADWTLADEAACRVLTLFEFCREVARPVCWNSRHVRRRTRRGLATVGAVAGRGTAPNYSPAMRGVSQTFLATVIADLGDSPTDDRRVDRKTVSRAFAMLACAGVLQCVQVPAHAAEPFEIGESGHAMNRVWLADRASPKPALMRIHTATRPTAADAETPAETPPESAPTPSATAPP